MLRRTLLLSSLAPLLVTVLAAAAQGCGGDDPKENPVGDRKLVVLFTSDEHSHLFAASPEVDDFPIANGAGKGGLVGGVARRAAVLAKLRSDAKSAGKDSILVSAGDNQMGCLPHIAFESQSVDYGTMKALGYDVTTFGNHEFDFGPQALANSINAAMKGDGLPPIVASNIHFSGGAGDADLADLYSEDATDDAPVHPYRVVTTDGGIKVGVLGMVGVNAAHVAPYKTPVQFSAVGVPDDKEGDLPTVLPKLYADLQPIVDTLRNDEKVDIVIALSHSGINDVTTQEGLDASEDYPICKNVAGIDFIVSGHAHNHDPRRIVVKNDKTKKDCLILQGSSFGQHVGFVEFTIPADSSKGVTFDENTHKLVPVTEATAPDSALATKTNALVETIEKAGYLEDLLSTVTGKKVTNNASKAGDLYFFPLGKTTYDVTEIHPLVWLSADSMLAAADEWEKTSGESTVLGLESAGVIRSVLMKGKSGVISAADAFNVVPLGRSPGDGSIGYPLIRAYVTLFELKAVFEFALALAPLTSDFNLGAAGIQVEFDKTRPLATTVLDLTMADKGQVMRILVDSNHADGVEDFDTVIYDRANPPDDFNVLFPVVTSSYIAEFAQDAQVSLKDKKGVQHKSIEETILKRADKSEIKQVEAFMAYLKSQGTLPPLYNASSKSLTKRWVCLKGCK